MFDYMLCDKKASRMFFLVVIFLVLLTSVSSCSKDKEVSAGLGGVVNVVVSVDGVKSLGVSSSLRASVGNQVGLQFPESKYVETFSQEDISFDVVSEEVDLASQVGLDVKLNNRSKLATTDLMNKGVKYRLMLYNASNDQFLESIEAEVGESRHIGLVSGQTYKWYAYSYNTNESIPEPVDFNNPTIVTPTANTLLYASGSIKAMSDGMPLSITFAHQLTQLKVEVKEGIRAILGSSAKFVSSDYIKTSNFNLKNGVKSEFKSVGVTDLNFESYVIGDTVMRVAQYYTADDQLTSYNVEFASIDVQYTKKSQRQLLPNQLPNSGKVTFSFPSGPVNKRGYILKGAIKLSFVLPEMRIAVYSNTANHDGYRLGSSTRAGMFVRDPKMFGPSSSYVKIKNLKVDDPSNSNLASAGSSGWNNFKNMMSNSNNWPDVLVIANYYNYLDAECWQLINQYLNSGGSVFYTQDESSAEVYAQVGLSNVFGQSLTLAKPGENGGVYRFTDTSDAMSDEEVLNGPFGDVRSYYWGQDRSGTTYMVGYPGANMIAYTTHSANFKAPANPGVAFARHKTKSFFYVGDGGFFANNQGVSYNSNDTFPFTTDANNLPITRSFGYAANPNSPVYGQAGTNKHGWAQVANSAIFGNALSWLLDRAQYYKN